MCRGTSFLEFRFLIFPINIQKIIRIDVLVVNNERGTENREQGTGNREPVTGNKEWNEEWE